MKILIVDDNERLAQSMADSMGELAPEFLQDKVEAWAISDPAKVDAAAAEFAPDIAIVDVKLGHPTLGGYEVVKGLYAIRKDIFVILFSAYAEEYEVERIRKELGIAHYFPKPFKMSDLMEFIATHYSGQTKEGLMEKFLESEGRGGRLTLEQLARILIDRNLVQEIGPEGCMMLLKMHVDSMASKDGYAYYSNQQLNELIGLKSDIRNERGPYKRDQLVEKQLIEYERKRWSSKYRLPLDFAKRV